MEGKIQELKQLKQLKQRIEELERKQVAEIAKVDNLLAALHGRDTEAHRVIVDWHKHRKAFLKDWQEKLLKYGIVVGSSPASPADSFTSAAEGALSPKGQPAKKSKRRRKRSKAKSRRRSKK